MLLFAFFQFLVMYLLNAMLWINEWPRLRVQKMAFTKAPSIISAAAAREGVLCLVCRSSFHSTGNCSATVIDGIGGKWCSWGKKRLKTAVSLWLVVEKYFLKCLALIKNLSRGMTVRYEISMLISCKAKEKVQLFHHSFMNSRKIKTKLEYISEWTFDIKKSIYIFKFQLKEIE